MCCFAKLERHAYFRGRGSRAGSLGLLWTQGMCGNDKRARMLREYVVAPLNVSNYYHSITVVDEFLSAEGVKGGLWGLLWGL